MERVKVKTEKGWVLGFVTGREAIGDIPAVRVNLCFMGSLSSDPEVIQFEGGEHEKDWLSPTNLFLASTFMDKFLESFPSLETLNGRQLAKIMRSKIGGTR